MAAERENMESLSCSFDEDQWAAIERLPTLERVRVSLYNEIIIENKEEADDAAKRKRAVDVTKLSSSERQNSIQKLIKQVEPDNLRLLQKIRKRLDKVGIELPTVEVRYNNLRVEAECEVVHGKPLPTLWNSFKISILDLVRLIGVKSQFSNISIINGVSGIIKPGRMTLLLGPPGCGKTSLLKALSGNLNKSLKVTGEISYNGYKLQEFVPQKTAAYISQQDFHIPDMTVRETLDFSSCCQGVGSRSEIMIELCRREKAAGILPDPDIDTFMKAISVEGQKTSLQTDYILKILGLNICADTLVGDALRRGISGGQKKRLTTGEMIIGPTNVLFMDEISNGLDSSTTYQVVACLQHLAHVMSATILVSLLQPAPETFDLFDDIILMAEGKIVYHGPRNDVLEFFESCGFRCPERKGVAEFLQEVLSRKDQAQYWHRSEATYSYISVDTLSKNFKESPYGRKLNEELSLSLVKSKGSKDALVFSTYSLPKWKLFRACLSREFLLMKRNSFVYVFKSLQLFLIASITLTAFLRTQMDVDVLHANYYLGALFYALLILVVDGYPELSLTVTRLAIFYKQRDLFFYPAWAYTIPTTILKIPLSLLEALVWTCLTYYTIGYSPELGRFFRQLILLFCVHFTFISMYRFVASVFRTMAPTIIAGNLSIFLSYLFGGFIIPRPSSPVWLKWAFWVSPLTYGEIALTVNEFLAPRWQQMLPKNITIGQKTLENRGLRFHRSFYWISIGALFGLALLFNIGFTLALSFLKAPGSRAIISREKLSQIQGSHRSLDSVNAEGKSRNSSSSILKKSSQGKISLPFEPLAVVFQDVQYYVDIPPAMEEHGVTQKKLQLLSDITGAFRPGVLTALMGVSGAGKTTLLDVLAGRKTCGTIEGEIIIGGYPKVQKTFARISGYCEQVDIHSPHITVEESVIFSAWLRLHNECDSKTRYEFVKEVLETIELDSIKDSLVGIAGFSGLSNEQRKRLTIAVELVSNPSIIFMDEPTTGLDARAAAIVMRAVKNIADTGRTIVCTIHQPSIDIFEAFDELILLKTGGKIIYSGALGYRSSKVIEYFEGIPGIPKIENNYNPATWMVEVTLASVEIELGLDFAQIYKESSLYESNIELVKGLRTPPSGSKELEFSTPYSQTTWGQFKALLWKQCLSYWRSPSYNLTRFTLMSTVALIFGAVFWNHGKKLDNQQSIFTIFGSLFATLIFCGVYNSSSVLPYIYTERSVFYRERFAGMYSPWAYAAAQVVIEVPYIFTQTLAFTAISYPMIGYYRSIYKVFWYFYCIFCTCTYFKYLGMLVASMTSRLPVATTILSTCYAVSNLFGGFLIPQPRIPKWWIWLYYMIPSSWTLNGLLTSQYGDINEEIDVFGKTTTLVAFLKDYYGFNYNRLPIVAVVLMLYPIIFASLFAFFIANLNFQKR
ncbi:hypothetical protein M9H77_27174 [Catharanthus roseus]|uniref:Uncharacterized protein n=1 Tax=Catharanthus roseus TaxID=4058 RepID=A0ACC0AFV9_CATRO|nr:hypothetical protein M9H77_27174 [Catharanthus roseus]